MPEVELVRPGLWSVPVVIPDSPLRYVLIYVIALPDGVALVDTGWPHEESWHSLESGLATLGFAIEDVRYILLTHSHHDHHGLTRQVKQRSGASVVMHSVENDLILEVEAGKASAAAQTVEWLRHRGADESGIQALNGQMAHGEGPAASDQLTADVLVEDGDRPLAGRPDLVALWTPGHTRGHLCFLLEDDRILLSGDHVLPRITPHVTRPAFVQQDPALSSYLRSLERIAELDVDEVLPAHEYRFSSLYARIQTMLAHHEDRFVEIQDAVRGGALTTWEIAEQISWSRGWEATRGFTRVTAVAETFTHLNHLEAIGRVVRTSSNPDSWTVIEAPLEHVDTSNHQRTLRG